jgi:hypothetical protein
MKARIAIPIAYIIAVVAEFDIHAEIAAVTAPNANRIRIGLAPTEGIESTA